MDSGRPGVDPPHYPKVVLVTGACRFLGAYLTALDASVDTRTRDLRVRWLSVGPTVELLRSDADRNLLDLSVGLEARSAFFFDTTPSTHALSLPIRLGASAHHSGPHPMGIGAELQAAPGLSDAGETDLGGAVRADAWVQLVTKGPVGIKLVGYAQLEHALRGGVALEPDGVGLALRVERW